MRCYWPWRGGLKLDVPIVPNQAYQFDLGGVVWSWMSHLFLARHTHLGLERGGLCCYLLEADLIRIEPKSFQGWKLALETESGLSYVGIEPGCEALRAEWGSSLWRKTCSFLVWESAFSFIDLFSLYSKETSVHTRVEVFLFIYWDSLSILMTHNSQYGYYNISFTCDPSPVTAPPPWDWIQHLFGHDTGSS